MDRVILKQNWDKEGQATSVCDLGTKSCRARDSKQVIMAAARGARDTRGRSQALQADPGELGFGNSESPKDEVASRTSG